MLGITLLAGSADNVITSSLATAEAAPKTTIDAKDTQVLSNPKVRIAIKSPPRNRQWQNLFTRPWCLVGHLREHARGIRLQYQSCRSPSHIQVLGGIKNVSCGSSAERLREKKRSCRKHTVRASLMPRTTALLTIKVNLANPAKA